MQLTDDDNTGVVNDAVVSGIISDADELIDGHLMGRYALPLTIIPGIVRSLSLDISAYNLYGRRAEFEIPKSVSDKYSAALKVLASIQKGDIKLGVAGVATPAPEATGDGMQATEPTRVFTEDLLGYY